MRKHRFFVASALLTLVPANSLWAQQNDPPAAAEASDAGQAAADAKAEFDARFTKWKEAIKQINLLRVEYQTADEARREELQIELQTRFEAANAMVPGVVESAIAAYRAAGGEDEELEQFLIAVAAQRVSSDIYGEALPAIEVLTQQGADHPGIPVWGAIAAFAEADYEAAEAHFQRAEQMGLFAEPPRTESQREMEIWGLAMQLKGLVAAHQEAWQKEQAIRAAEAEADDLPRVLLRTTKGDITLELFENEAPNTVKNFITLVEQGSYDGTAFHRVLSNFMAQGGDPTTAGNPEPGYNIACECYRPDARKHFRGSLSMAHAGRDTGNAGFFLTFRPTPHLDGTTFHGEERQVSWHTVFGRVIEGLEVLADLNRVNPQAPPEELAAQPAPDRIIEATVLRKRPGTDYGDVKKL